MADRKELQSPAIGQQPSAISFARLCEIVARLRAPGGCPWDREQTHESLLPATIEEAYEVAEAARSKNDSHFREELGDLLLLVVMHAEIAREAGRFNIDNVLGEISDKLVRRHPHVFGTVEAGVSPAISEKQPRAPATTAAVVLKQWEAIKRAEKKTDTHYLSSLPGALPALMRAQKAQSKVARVNFDWSDLKDVIAKVEEELGELKSAIKSEDGEAIEDELGDLLFAVVNLSRKSRIDAEVALQAATDKFVRRFNLLEDELTKRGQKLGDVGLAELDEIWNEIKRR
ncbi:MAG TPA: nucleoside triphosphate pyrophosphohydrolase [Chthoniobacterales bacterium]